MNQNNIEYVSISRSEGIDVLNLDSLLEQPKCTHIVHLAAKTFVPESFDKPGDFYKFNLNSTIANGYYFVKIKVDDKLVLKPFVLQK